MKKKYILLVEDNPDDEFLTIRALKQNNLANNMRVVRDGEEALDYLFGKGTYEGRYPSHVPEVILLDIMLPKLSGLEVLKRIKQNEYTKRLPVVMLTSLKEEQDLIDSYRLGANSYVRKPVDFLEFSRAVKSLGLYWLVINEKPPIVRTKK